MSPKVAGEASPPWRIAFLSFAILSLELALIRQIPAEVKAISYFTNLVLVAAFFGLGLGCILQRHRRLFALLPLGLFLVFAFILICRGIVIYESSPGIHFWLDREMVPGRARNIPLLPAAVAAFLASALPFVALGQALAQAMDAYDRLVAYGWDIAGSLLGTVLFAVSSLLGLPPWAWVASVATLCAFLLTSRLWERAALVASGLAFLVFSQASLPGTWSPYYFVQHDQTGLGLRVFVNSSFHQMALRFDGSEANRETEAAMLAKWGQAYDVYKMAHGRPPRRVLVLGAGTGNDVVVALLNGAAEVVAVEIDPVILGLGRRENRAMPYADSKVTAVVDDARHYLRGAHRPFDMIVFGTLDSQVLLSGHSNLRLDNYVYTRESLHDARRLLAPGGMVTVFYSVSQEWLFARLYSTVREVFGDESVLMIAGSPALFNTTLMGAPGVALVRDTPENIARYGAGRSVTDDWPFPYLEQPGIAPLYLQLMGVVGVLVVLAFMLLRRLHPATGIHANFAFLGLGFTLMQSSAVVRLALLFGSTWVVNAVVFSAILLTIFVANLLVHRGLAPPLRAVWVGLGLFILGNYAFPVSALVALDAPARVLAASLLIGLPVMCAAFAFSHLFRREAVTGYPLGVNLVGAMAGGLVEYVSMALGMRAVWILVFVVYTLAWVATERAAARQDPQPA